MPVWIKLFKKVKPQKTLIPSLIIMVLSKIFLPILFLEFRYFDRIFVTYIFYWIFGCVVGLNYERIKSLFKKHFEKELIIFAFFAVLNAVLSYISFAYQIYVPFLEYLHMFYCISAIIFVFALFTDRKVPTSAIKNIDNSSFYIFLSHCYIMNWVNRVINKIGIESLITAFFIRAIAVYSITLILCISYTKAKQYIKTSKLLK